MSGLTELVSMDADGTADTEADAAAFRRAMRRWSTGVTLVTCGTGAATEVMTANAVTSVSLQPLLLLASLRTEGRMCRTIARNGGFAVHILSERQHRLAALFATRGRPRGMAAEHRLGTGSGTGRHAVLVDAMASFECETDSQVAGGDHTIFLGRVTAITLGEPSLRPLIFHEGRYAGLQVQPSTTPIDEVLDNHE